MNYNKINKIDVDGKGNIVLQDVNGGTITVNYNDIDSLKEVFGKISEKQVYEIKQIFGNQNKEILEEIRKIQDYLAEKKTENSINEYITNLDEFFKELEKNDIETAKKRILKDYSMLHEYQNMLILEDDPMRKKRYELQIENIKTNIVNEKKELLRTDK